MRVLLTGGAWRLGITICKSLLRDGSQVRIFDLDSANNRKSVQALHGKAEIYWGDITQPDSLIPAMDKIDTVVHMAAILPPVADEKPELAQKVNIGGTKNLVDLIKKSGRHIPLIYTSSAAVFGPTPNAIEPLCPDKNDPHPKGVYGETKYLAETAIRESGIDHAILRLTATMYLLFKTSDLKRMFSIPLNNRIEYCHPDDTAAAIINAVNDFETVKGNTFVISGGPHQRMLYKDMIGNILKVLGLPLPPAKKFTEKPYYLDWYDTDKSQKLLRFQMRSFSEYLTDFSGELTRVYSPIFLPFMRYFVGPIFGKLITRLI